MKSEEQIMEELQDESERLFTKARTPTLRRKEIRINFNERGAESPFGKPVDIPGKVKGYSGDYQGAFSMETFCDQAALSYTHEDAAGWLAYLEKFNPSNFWYKDGYVSAWAYYEDYDNWQDTYGMDAVKAVYHSGHGGMDANGVFGASLGSNWGGLGCTAYSNKMRLGNEQVNYIFWSTCQSLRVLGGHSPVKTWSPANLGFRMLFGYETNSVDSPNYGKFFWEEWCKGKSLCYAWLDASWRISHHQSPSVVACGSTSEEAVNRREGERYLYWGHIVPNYWAWRWYYAASGFDAFREPNLNLPKDMLIADLQPMQTNGERAVGLLKQFDLLIEPPEEVTATPEGIFFLSEDEERIAFGRDGSYEIELARPNFINREQLSLSKAKSKANEAVRRYGLDRDIELTFDRIRLEAESNCKKDGSDNQSSVSQTTVQFKQVINGLPVVTPGAGEVRVSIDNDGSITKMHSSTRPIEDLTDRPKNTTAAPLEEGGHIARPKASDKDGIESLLAKKWQERMAFWVMRGKLPFQYTVVPGTTEVGYDINNNQASLVAQRMIEVDFGKGYFKRYLVVTPLLE